MTNTRMQFGVQGEHTEARGESHEAERTAARLCRVVIRGEGGDAGDDEGQAKAVEGTPHHGLRQASCRLSNLKPEKVDASLPTPLLSSRPRSQY